MKVACVQFEVAEGEWKKNLDKAKELLESSQADLYLLPELWSCGLIFDRIQPFCEHTPKALSELNALSLSKKATIIGSLPEEKEGRIYNTAYLLEKGEIKARYRKMNLFPPMKEDRFLSSGVSVSVFSNIGLAICYDIRFDVVKLCAEKGAEIIAVSSAWPLTRINHLEILLKARALENSVFILCANQTGGRFGGNSAIINPEGEVIVQMEREEGVLSVDIDLSLAKEARKKRYW